MRRLAALFGTLIIAFGLLVPVALGADPVVPNTGRVLISIQGDVTLPADQQADTVIVVGGRATILGDTNAVVAIDGSAVLQGSRVETVVAISSPIELASGTVVTGDLVTLDSAVSRAADAQVQGTTRDLAGDFAAFGLFFAAAMILWFIGLGIAAIVAGLVLVAIATRQVREMEGIIVHEPIKAFGVGLLGTIAIAIVGIAAIVTIIGAPIGLAVLSLVLPLVSTLGFLVTGVWIGEWIVRNVQPGRVHERPYLAAFLGILVLLVLTFVPFVSGILSLFGTGAVLLFGWRAFRAPSGVAVAPRPAPMPMPG